MGITMNTAEVAYLIIAAIGTLLGLAVIGLGILYIVVSLWENR